jgi:hypothetical protein
MAVEPDAGTTDEAVEKWYKGEVRTRALDPLFVLT